MKSILFVINTMGIGGAEKSLLELLNQIDLEQCEVALFVLTGQGELMDQVPAEIKLLNTKRFSVSVLDSKGKRRLIRTILKAMLVRGTVFKRFKYMMINLCDMIGTGKLQKDKLLWKILSDGAQRVEQEYDLAVAYVEGGAAYYVASHVKAQKKAAFIHTDYSSAGYNRKLDENCYAEFDQIFTVSESVKKSFLSVYPECKEYTEIFYNFIDRQKIIERAKEEGGFSDGYRGIRILTVGRLVPQKALHIAIGAMKILKSSGRAFRWYVLGEGVLRKKLEEQIRALGLEKDFYLLGSVQNPFPYYVQCDLYVHTSCLEGKSIAIEEAQILGCAILATEHSGIQEQIEDGVDGQVCESNSTAVAEMILDFVDHPKKMEAYRYAALKRRQVDFQKQMEKFTKLLLSE